MYRTFRTEWKCEKYKNIILLVFMDVKPYLSFKNWLLRRLIGTKMVEGTEEPNKIKQRQAS
jgi:hypothetical protein